MSDERTRAIIAASRENQRENPALEADAQYKPAEWTEAQERELVEHLHGTEAQRIDALIARQNEEMRHR